VQVDKEAILLKNGSQSIKGKMYIEPESTNDQNGEGKPETAALTAPQGIQVNGRFNEYNLTQEFSSLASYYILY
jgi:hypothetical protein